MYQQLGSNDVTAAAFAVLTSMAGYTGREQQLRLEIESCAEGPVLAGLLTELAGLHIAAVSSQHCSAVKWMLISGLQTARDA
jgi:hypothetical protein